MITATLGDHHMDELWPENDPDRKFGAGWALYWATGNTATSALLTVMEPDSKIPMHTDSVEEIILVLEGEIEAWIEGYPPVRLKAGMMAVNPPLVNHTMHNVGTTQSRVVGFMCSNTVLSEFPEAPLMPPKTQVAGTPPPDLAAQQGYKKQELIS